MMRDSYSFRENGFASLSFKNKYLSKFGSHLLKYIAPLSENREVPEDGVFALVPVTPLQIKSQERWRDHDEQYEHQ